MRNLEFEEWVPIYNEIISDFGYSKEEDRRSAEILAKMRGTDTLSPLEEMEGSEIEIGGPYYIRSGVDYKVAAGSALSQMVDRGVQPDLIVTDLDGDTGVQLSMHREGIPVVIHAHGDNMDLIEKWSKKFDGTVISTCQCEPPQDDIYNFGGFTDGDRAVFLADHFNAKKVTLNGWDLERTFHENEEIKLKKLRWAKRLLERVDIPIEYKNKKE